MAREPWSSPNLVRAVSVAAESHLVVPSLRPGLAREMEAEAQRVREALAAQERLHLKRQAAEARELAYETKAGGQPNGGAAGRAIRAECRPELMTRPRRTTLTKRYHLTVSTEFAARLDAFASGLRQRPATVAASLLEAALERAVRGQQEHEPESEELADARRHIEELNRRLSILRAQHAKCTQTPDSFSTSLIGRSGPRWEWPLPALLSDVEWWDRWLPRLYELLGRQLMQYTPTPGQVLDRRGYADLMTFLFPPISRGTAIVTWRSPNYGKLAELEGSTEAAGPVRAQVWEPVIRHLTEALCALEATGRPSADPYLRIRAKAEIVNSWADILRNLLGETAPALPRSG